ncbi:MAG TPA: recombinase family protein, partial [Propionibacteriaceae bacterium]|nr:recombinase family protein [Propionibacteriaceae bacterium]
MAALALDARRWIAIYVRISKDREGRKENVATQEKLAREYAARHWPGFLVVVYCDNDLTAADPDTERPDYERMLADIRLGKVAQVVSADQDRLTRQPSEWEELVVILGSAGITETHGYRDGITPVKGSKLVGRVKAAVSAEYVEGIKVKVNEKLDALAAEGRPTGGRSYGYRHVAADDGIKALEVIPERAAHLRWAADAVLAGWSLSGIARELVARSAPTARGGKWHASTVREMLLSPTVAGLRVHKGEVIRRGTWEPILDEALWRQVVAKLSAPRVVAASDGPRRVLSVRRHTGRRWVLTGGIAVCGRCGAALIASRRSRANGTEISPAYLCQRAAGGCNGIGIQAEPLEALVRDELIAWLRTDEFAAILARDEHEARRAGLTKQLGTLEERRIKLSLRWSRGDLEDDEWDAAR